MSLDILYRDEHIIAINKPHGLLVHRSEIARDASEFALQILRDQIGQQVYPAHRLDRKTGGVLLFALHEKALRLVRDQFSEKKINKKYLAIVRGFTEDTGEIDYPLKKENGLFQDAYTAYKTLDRTELLIPFGKHKSIRYSLVEAYPQTGRMHQIRKHFAHIHHPIIGDRPHGCNKQNKLFREKWNMITMLLHAFELSFFHPVTNEDIMINAPLQSEFQRTLSLLDFQKRYSL